MLNNTFTLPDGRTLGYAFYGLPEGQPVLYLHGTPGSRLEPLLLNLHNHDINGLVSSYNLRIISVDRPGMGLSSCNPKGTFSSFAKDASELLSHLNIKACRLLCWSGGGPFALSMAYHHPSLISHVFIINGFTLSLRQPGVFKHMAGNKHYFRAARYVPAFVRWVLARAAKSEAGKPIPQWLSKLPHADHLLLTDAEVNKRFANATLKEVCRNGTGAQVYEAALYFTDYGYDLSRIVQPVHFWRGAEDNVVPLMHAQAVKQHVPASTMHYIPGEGHLSLYVHWIEDVLAGLSRINA